jgi:hypothetical protein
MNTIDTVITDLEMLKNGSWIPDKDSCEASIRMLERAKTEFDRMYSEEEVKQIIEATLIEYSDYVLADILEWFEQFKKKQNEK